jgi:hypothetical protein
MFWSAGVVLGADLMARIKSRLPTLPKLPGWRRAPRDEG